jgi:tetraacyldisaccharide-1-P 4'-kinase
VLFVARALEEGAVRGRIARAAARAWGSVSARHVVRRLALPPHVRVVTVGGATLGGSGKTPLAIACARELARTGARVAFVGHAYRARPGRARVVGTTDPLHVVGDEALVAAELEGHRVPVVVAPDRASATIHAARLADVLVIDGVAQTRPVRATLALLAVDPEEPWGRSAALPPCGDLRAPVEALLEAADAVVPVIEDDDVLFPWDSLRGARVGLVCALARPQRVLRSLARRGVVPRVVVRARDHTSVANRALLEHERSRSVDVWVATRKCSLHVARPTMAGETPRRDNLVMLPHAVRLPPWLRTALEHIGRALTPTNPGNNLNLISD